MSKPVMRLVMLVALVAVAGCTAALRADAPGPGVPRADNLRFIPDRVTVGCPVTMRVQFDDPDADVVRAVYHWTLQQARSTDSGHGTAEVAPREVVGQTTGEIAVQVTPERYGRYWYHVQVEDAKGRKSNVLTGAILVDAPAPWRTTGCE